MSKHREIPMPHIISTVCPGASGAARNELSPLDLDHVTGGDAASNVRQMQLDAALNGGRTGNKAADRADSYIRG
jgi:hypothetical protein